MHSLLALQVDVGWVRREETNQNILEREKELRVPPPYGVLLFIHTHTCTLTHVGFDFEMRRTKETDRSASKNAIKKSVSGHLPFLSSILI